jgi:hypothetical protein
MPLSAEGFWIESSIFGDGSFSQSVFEVYEPPGRDIYATITLSGIDHFPNDGQHFASAYIDSWTFFDADGKRVGVSSSSPGLGRAQNSIALRNCGSLYFVLEVANWTLAVAQISIFTF